MKRIAIIVCLAFMGPALQAQPAGNEQATDSFYLLTPVELRAIRANQNAPFTKTNLSKQDISKQNLGADIPFLLNQTPSVVVHSDAGNAVGYTGIRIRGTDATRINITLNGIPYNDAESQGTFFVDLPDFASSLESVQVQRGVGTSSNGAGAFGASINFSTNGVNRVPYLELSNSAGSFNTWKNTIRAGTGMIADQFTADIRLSRISSNGYIDRADSDLQSYYFSSAWIANRSNLRLNIFSGKEKTYQAWNGISEADLRAGNRTINYAGMAKPGAPYENETDNFKQDHYQIFFDHRVNERISFNAALFLTKGEGYYEQYRAGEEYSNYAIPPPAAGVSTTDLIRQLWLDNDFYGGIFSAQIRQKNHSFSLGGSWTQYDGNHHGDIIWASQGLPVPLFRWYDHDAVKKDFTIYFKQQTTIQDHWHLFYDLQYRRINYMIDGFRDNPGIDIDARYNFFNPKLGLSYTRNNWKAYASYSIANKEPNRDDFETGLQPRRERLNDIELGIERSGSNASWSATLYHMFYKDQLVLTGKINDVGAYTRTNIPESYRMGLEMSGRIKPISSLNLAANLSWSRNKVKNFTEYMDDYDAGGQKLNQFSSTDIAFSPSIVGGAEISYLPCRALELSLISKYVGKQYLDNTQNEARKLNAFYTQDVRARFSPRIKFLKELSLIGQVYNLFDRKYEPNGYTFSYIYGGETITENFYFPMAGINFMIGVNVKL